MLLLKSTGHLELVLELSSHSEATTNSKITVTGTRTRLIYRPVLCFLDNYNTLMRRMTALLCFLEEFQSLLIACCFSFCIISNTRNKRIKFKTITKFVSLFFLAGTH